MVASWDDTEVARRWMLLCPDRKTSDGAPEEPSEPELNSIRTCPDRVKEIRSRLSDISWWMRLLCQRVAQRANREDEQTGKFFQDRFRAVRLLDEASLLACAAYVDLNPIRAALAETLEQSDYTSAQRQIVPGKTGSTPVNLPPVLNRLGLTGSQWTELVRDFGKLFSSVAGQPKNVDTARSHRTHRRFYLTRRVRELLPADM